MVTVLPPGTSLTFIASLVIPLILGFLIGIVIKSAVKIGTAIVLIVIVLLVAGIISPSQVIQPVVSLFKSGTELASKVEQVAGYLPYSSIGFLVGLVLGYLKG